jgi:hypothetical protein
MKEYNSAYIRDPYIHTYCGTIHNCQIMEKMVINGGMGKENVKYLCNGVFLSH